MSLKLGPDGFFHHKYENGNLCNFGITESIGLSLGASGAAASTSGFEAVGLATSLVSAGIGALGSMEQGQAASASAKYNAAVAANNASIARQNAAYAGAAGTAQAEQASLQTRSKVGAIVANEAAGGINVNTGSALDVRSSAQQLGELNAITVKSNAVRQAYGYETQSANYTAESGLDTYQAQSDSSAGSISAGGTLLGGVGSAATRYAEFVRAGGSVINPFNGGA